MQKKKGIIELIFSVFSIVSFSQGTDNNSTPLRLEGSVTVTNYGISLIPNFTLGKPAAIFDISAGKRLTFEPQMRVALEGKPWSFLFWWRYKFYEGEKLKFNAGVHPALSFRYKEFIVDDIPKEYTVVYRYLAGELSPVYTITKNISAGVYYLYSYCLDNDPARNTNFLAIRLYFSNIKLGKQYYLKFTPQVYYLKMDADDGYYATSSLTLVKRDFPLSVSSMANTPIKTSIYQSKSFIWNISIVYTFGSEYQRI